jgi:hypothetical protein
LTSLVRTRVGPSVIDEARTFEDLAGAGGPEEYLIDLERARDLLDPQAVQIPPEPGV